MSSTEFIIFVGVCFFAGLLIYETAPVLVDIPLLYQDTYRPIYYNNDDP